MRFVHQHADYISSADGRRYIAQVYAAERSDQSWEAWCVFFPSNGDNFIATDPETTQSNFDAVRYWASGLTHRYFEGALERALEPDRDASPVDERLRRQHDLAEAEAYAAAAQAARQRAHENEVLKRAMRRGIRFG